MLQLHCEQSTGTRSKAQPSLHSAQQHCEIDAGANNNSAMTYAQPVTASHMAE
jgi:hypothetical protein